MKKIILGSLAVAMCFTVTACGTSQGNATVTSLGNQLDQTANTISSVETVSPTELTLSEVMNEEESKDSCKHSLHDNMLLAQQSLLNEEYYKMDILNKTSKIKNKLSKDVKLSKAQANAVKELTSNLTKYTNSVGYTRNELKNTVKSISSLKKNTDKNSDKINAKLNKLACNSNTRACYYQNILNTLNQIENFIGIDEDDTNSQDSTTETPNNLENETNSTEPQNKSGLPKNIDTYLPSTNQTCPKCGNEITDAQNNKTCPNCGAELVTPIPVTPYNNMPYNTPYNAPYNTPYNPYNSNNFNPYANNYGGMPYNYGMQNYGYNTPYAPYNRAGFNPNRNTDSFGPMARNIDTYRGYGYNYNEGLTNPGYNFNTATPVGDTALVNSEIPEQRLEDFEKVNEDKTIEKVTPPEEKVLEEKICDNKVCDEIKKECSNEECEKNVETSIENEKEDKEENKSNEEVKTTNLNKNDKPHFGHMKKKEHNKNDKEVVAHTAETQDENCNGYKSENVA